MARAVSLSDAVRILGGTGKAAKTLDAVTGGLLLGAAPALPAVLNWFDARAEFARLSQRLIRSAAEAHSGLGRISRTERVAAAHTITVVAAYFHAMAAAPLPMRFSDLKLTRREQLALVDASGGSSASLITAIRAAGNVLPTPHLAGTEFHQSLTDYYARLSARTTAFVSGLRIWDQLSETDRTSFAAALADLPPAAYISYLSMINDLAVDFPEVRLWLDQREHRTTRDELRRIEPALASLHDALAAIAPSAHSTVPHQALARANRAPLGRSIVESGDLPPGISVPTLEVGYLPPRFRVAEADPNVSANDEDWWDRHPIGDDLGDFFLRHLVSPQATDAPILLLGQPGAGKSVLTKLIAGTYSEVLWWVCRRRPWSVAGVESGVETRGSRGGA